MTKHDPGVLESIVLRQMDNLFHRPSRTSEIHDHGNNRTGARTPVASRVPVMSLVREPSEHPQWQNVLPMQVSVYSDYLPPKDGLAGVLHINVGMPAHEIERSDRIGVKSSGARTILNNIARRAGLKPVSDGSRFKWEMGEGSPEVARGEVYITQDLLGKTSPDEYSERYTFFFHHDDTQKMADAIAGLAKETGKRQL